MFKLRLDAGFTLIEVMIAVAIVAILARMALPSYQEYVRRGARAEARAAIMNLAQLQERNFSDRGTYVQVTSGSSMTSPWNSYNWSGSDFASRKYDITVDVTPSGCSATSNCTAYTITAAPLSSDPNCGNLSLTSAGTRGSSAGTVDYCWK